MVLASLLLVACCVFDRGGLVALWPRNGSDGFPKNSDRGLPDVGDGDGGTVVGGTRGADLSEAD